jgi:hypothetical protein
VGTMSDAASKYSSDFVNHTSIHDDVEERTAEVASIQRSSRGPARSGA